MKNNSKIIIYQIFTRLFGNLNNNCIHNGSILQNGCGKLKEINDRALNEIKKLGITHIWYTGVIEHATQTDYTANGISKDHPAIVKGKAGSPYAIKDYYDIDPDLANNVDKRMQEFEALIKRTHRTDLKAIIDFVPNHVARQYHSDNKPKGIKDLGKEDNVNEQFNSQNNFYYIPNTELKCQFDMKDGAKSPYHEYPAKATGNDKFDAYPNRNDWYETIKLNYGVDYLNGGNHHFSPIPNTWQKMLDILLFWASKDVDGFRCDMAEMVPVEFWEWVIPQVKEQFPHIIFIAEVYQPHLYDDYIYRGHFDYLYDKVGLYDTLRGIVCNNLPAKEITTAWQALDNKQSHMLNFLENHDEQRIASDYFAGNPWKAIPALVVSACMNTNPMMIYFGQELGEPGMDEEGYSGRDGRTTIFDYWCVESIRRWNNFGRYDGKLLSEEQHRLRRCYQKILTLCNEEKALAEGLFFDLTYANINGWRYDEDKQFSFIRKCDNEMILCVVNFDYMERDIAINIPAHAFQYMQIPPSEKYQAVDLITGDTETISFTAYKATDTIVKGYGAKLLKIVFEPGITTE